jgi:valyl-tRNA synthetase
MDRVYDPQKYEREIYRKWEASGAFKAEYGEKDKREQRDKKEKFYTILMPPPNANDPLHIGHAMFVTIEDLLIRWKRMMGFSALWLPGTDHAGIETQYVFEKKLAKEGKSRFDFDRETLYRMIWDYVKENSDVAVNQMKRLGASADWSRKKFTLDQDVVDFVLNTFIQLHNDGLIYRGLRLVNFCTKCGTGFSELEVKHVERQAPLYFMKYGPFSLATVRPETKFGDTAVAVNPKDKRYQKYIGKEIEVEGLLGKFKMKVIGDSYVDMKFGTGVVKVTPCHDPNDFEMWQRHKNEMPEPKQVIDFSGRMSEGAGKYQGLKVAAARLAVAEDLKKAGLLIKVDENYRHTIGVCYRCSTALEPLPLPQFYVKVKDKKINLTKMALGSLKKNQVKIIGAGHDKILRHWLKNLKDWNISRQIVWGIRLPIWYRAKSQNCDIEVKFIDKNKKLIRGKVCDLLKNYSLAEIKDGLQELRAPAGAKYTVSVEEPGEDYLQEADTFDTWFSSAQWPVVTLKTGKPGDFETFYPTDVMETGYDILPFWVMRMLVVGLYLTKQVPFKKVYLHGLIRDEKGQKMSKSKGNAINPLSMVEKYGADALRMALVIRSTPGLDKGVGENDIRAMRNLTNKIWNAARYVISKGPTLPRQGRTLSDNKFLEKLNAVVKTTTKYLEDYRIGLAAETVYNEFWHWFCDKAIESNKRQEISDKAIFEGLTTFLKLLHPFVPFVTEAVWQQLRQQLQLTVNSEQRTAIYAELLIWAKWPEATKISI